MSNVIIPEFRQHHLGELADDIMNCINAMGEEQHLSVAETVGVLEMVKSAIIRDAVEQEMGYDED